METQNWIAISGLFLTLTSLAIGQWKAYNLGRRAEKRLNYKLKLFEILLDERLTIAGLIAEFERREPLAHAEKPEIRKCVYEMVSEETIVAYSDLTFEANSVEDDNDDDEDEGGEDKPVRSPNRRRR